MLANLEWRPCDRPEIGAHVDRARDRRASASDANGGAAVRVLEAAEDRLWLILRTAARARMRPALHLYLPVGLAEWSKVQPACFLEQGDIGLIGGKKPWDRLISGNACSVREAIESRTGS